jgi:hypothetical protein
VSFSINLQSLVSGRAMGPFPNCPPPICW